jgi:hypothetical protein
MISVDNKIVANVFIGNKFIGNRHVVILWLKMSQARQ